jgi:hypothetical protein
MLPRNSLQVDGSSFFFFEKSRLIACVDGKFDR